MKGRLVEFISKITKEVHEEIEPKTKVHYHARLQKALVNSAVYFNLKGVSEYKIFYDERKGKIDIVWFDNDNSLVTAIEIDSSLREKSIMKLLTSNALYKVQVYYGNKSEGIIQKFRDTYDTEKEVIFIHFPLNLLRSKDVGDIEQHTLF
ncbi:hypothetical protein [Peribacillus frigoritolerans]|uniref:hypothetical protein n=1 Tax=Peribacillus frigoritolerans TaxID=450367 RepID=UPI003B8D7712|nr:hypothetical protein [Campylobacter jejuni]